MAVIWLVINFANRFPVCPLNRCRSELKVIVVLNKKQYIRMRMDLAANILNLFMDITLDSGLFRKWSEAGCYAASSVAQWRRDD